MSQYTEEEMKVIERYKTELLEKMPKEKDMPEFIKSEVDEEEANYNGGYNSCLKEITKLINGKEN